MTKIDIFRRLVEPQVLKAIESTYGVRIADATERQQKLVDAVTTSLYAVFGDALTGRKLQEIVDAARSKEIPPTV